MSLQPHQVKDLIISTYEKIKSLEEKYEATVEKIKEKFNQLRPHGKSNLELDRREEHAIEEQKKIYEKALGKLNDLLKGFQKIREEMISDLSLPPETEEYLVSLNL